MASLAFDLGVAVFSIYAAFLTAYGYPRILYVPAQTEKMLGFAIAAFAAFMIFKPYRGSWRYVSIPDLITIAKAALLAVVIFTVGSFLLTRGEHLPRSVPILTFIYIVALFCSSRLIYRLLVEGSFQLPGILSPRSASQRIVILCGYTDKAENFLRAAKLGGNFAVPGILDDTERAFGRTMRGVPVLGKLDNLPDVLARINRPGVEVRELVVTEENPSRQRLSQILEIANDNGLKVSLLPDVMAVSEVTSNFLLDPKPIEIEDLLERPEVKADLEQVAELIRDRVVMVTGAGGSIGSELSRQIAAIGPSMLAVTDSSEFMLYTLESELKHKCVGEKLVARILDVRDQPRVIQLIRDLKPDVIFHAAALKHVPMMEENPLEAIKTNVLGTRNVADAALAQGVETFVMISTDKVVNPTSIMGATKRAAEAYCQALDIQSTTTRFRTVRFGNVLGSNGSVVPRFREQIAAGGPVTVTHPEIVRFFMTIPEAVRLVLHASAHAMVTGNGRGKIMVLDMGNPVRIADLAERMIRLAGFRPRVDIDIVYTGLRPGEKLYEELFDASELPDERTEEGYVIASPRVIDRELLDRTLTEISVCSEHEDATGALELLWHIVPEYNDGPRQQTTAPSENLAQV
ncbi:polysaccharide biosynthesis protein [Aquamicrobium zhengzhouense]|nr:nucleoside-diphosphate sugar epimerase/dehydratase [Aquamicrobium zhengzhouense]